MQSCLNWGIPIYIQCYYFLMPRCAHVQTRYTVVCDMCVCACHCVCVHVDCYSCNDKRSASKSLHRLLVTFSWIAISGYLHINYQFEGCCRLLRSKICGYN